MIIFPKDLSHLQHEDHFERWIDKLVGRNWVVYCKSPFSNAEEVVRYIGRYTHRVAISKQRIVKVKNGRVFFRYKDYKASRRAWKEMDLSGLEFIRRFLSHVLPKGFHKIRHYGFLANGRCKTMISHIMSLLNTEPIDKPDNQRVSCPECKKGWMLPLFVKDGFGRIVNFSKILFNSGFIFDTS